MIAKQTTLSPYVLIILDGWGIAKHQPDNPIEMAKTPVYNNLWDKYIHSTLSASGEDVGLMPGQEGNSEAGHMNIGAGRIIKQDVVVISQSIEDGTFKKNSAFRSAVHQAKKNGGALHLMGLLSDKNSGHANPEHLLALLKLARYYQLKQVYLHLFTDGRDTPKHAGLGFIRELSDKLHPNEKIATIIGRLYLDRKKDWMKTKKAFDVLVCGRGKIAKNAEKAIKDAYAEGESDEFISPTVISEKNNTGDGRITDKDAVIFFNLRSDRARQLTKPFVQHDFEGDNKDSFKRCRKFKNLIFVAMTDFGPDLDRVLTAYPSADIKGTLPETLRDLKQVYIAEGEKYAHMTYFFNGGYDMVVSGEDRIFVPSPEVNSYDKTPNMSTADISKILINNIRQNKYNFYATNFCNADMIGHTGNLSSAIKAVECIDKYLGLVIDAALAKKGTVFITADHGNIEEIVSIETGEIKTEHSVNPVPFIIVDKKISFDRYQLLNGRLADIAPTILGVMGIKPSREMTGRNLLIKK